MALWNQKTIDEHAVLKGKYAYFYSFSVFKHAFTNMSLNKVFASKTIPFV